MVNWTCIFNLLEGLNAVAVTIRNGFFWSGMCISGSGLMMRNFLNPRKYPLTYSRFLPLNHVMLSHLSEINNTPEKRSRPPGKESASSWTKSRSRLRQKRTRTRAGPGGLGSEGRHARWFSWYVAASRGLIPFRYYKWQFHRERDITSILFHPKNYPIIVHQIRKLGNKVILFCPSESPSIPWPLLCCLWWNSLEGHLSL